MAFEYGQQVDSQGNITHAGSWGVQSLPKTSIPIIIENLRSLKDDSIVTPATHSQAWSTITGTPTDLNNYGISTTDTLLTNNFLGINANAVSATKLATGRTIGLTGDVTGTSGVWDGSGNLSFTATLANSGVTAGTYNSVTVDAKGRVTAGTKPTTLSGYGITDAAHKSNPIFTGNVTIGSVGSTYDLNTKGRFYIERSDSTNAGTLLDTEGGTSNLSAIYYGTSGFIGFNFKQYNNSTNRTVLTLDGSGNMELPLGNLYLDSGMLSSATSSSPLRFGINGVEKARVDTNGNFGTGGVTSPQANWHSGGSTIVGINPTITWSQIGNLQINFSYDSNTNQLYLNAKDSTGGTHSLIFNAGVAGSSRIL